MSFYVSEREGKELTAALRDELSSNDPKDRKHAARRVINLMRSGENVGALFASMLRCVKTDDFELKRLVYLFLLTYAQQEPEQSIMAVNTFIQDSQHDNPLVRALAIRTMSRIRIETVVEHLVLPLKLRFDDRAAYVRKTVALAVAKLYSIIPETIENAGVLPLLVGLLGDENPMVVANTTAAIREIDAMREEPLFKAVRGQMTSIINALMNSTEWCQCVLMDALVKYEPDTPEEATRLIERLSPMLRHKNPAVVVGSFRCIFVFMEFDGRNPQDIFQTVLQPFVSLVTCPDPEIQFVVLRTLALFVQKYPKLLVTEIRIFFCKYNDPSFVKMEKLAIITANTTAANAALVLDELTEYCNSVDVGFVKRAVKSIGEIALRIDASARRCVDILVRLVEGKAEYAAEQSVIVLVDILRKFPGAFESVIGKFCRNVEILKDSNARAAMIWILGEYCHLIENVDVVLDPFLDTFGDEVSIVQIQLVSTVVKLYLLKPEETSDMLQFVLNEATKESRLPDVRNRALVYWRMLSMSPETAKKFVTFQKESVEHSGEQYTSGVVQELLDTMGLVSGVMHVLPSEFTAFWGTTSPMLDGRSDREWKPVHLTSGNGGVAIYSDWSPKSYFIRIVNVSDNTLTGFDIAAKGNGSGLEIDQAVGFPENLRPTDTCEIAIGYAFNPSTIVQGASASNFEVAVKTSQGVVYYTEMIDTRRIATHTDRMKKTDFLAFYESHPRSMTFALSGVSVASAEELVSRNLNVVAVNDGEICLSFSLASDKAFICDLEIRDGSVHGCVKGNESLFDLLRETAKYAFCRD